MESKAPSRPSVSRLALGLACLALAGCNGSDGSTEVTTGGGSDPTPSDPPPASDQTILSRYFVDDWEPYRTAAEDLIRSDPRYLIQSWSWWQDTNGNGRRDPATEPLRDTNPLVSSGIYWAHAAGLTGAGTVIAIVDAGFLTSHEAFEGKTLTLAQGVTLDDHGTEVASVAAGNSGQMVGVAPGADLILGSYDTFATRTDATRLALSMGAVAQNNSWGFFAMPATQENYDLIAGSANGSAYLDALGDYAAEGVVLFAVDNDPTISTIGIMAGLPLFDAALEDGWLAVINGDASMSGDDVVGASRISGACLEAADWCLAAEGAWYAATSTGDTDYDLSTGTSFATPTVAGALALLAEAFPDLTPHDLRIRLLASADDDFAGFAADHDVELVEGFYKPVSLEWGHGFLDVQAALSPIGPTAATMADGSVYSLAEPLVVEGAATGDAVARSLDGVEIAVVDALAAGFAVPADLLVARPAVKPVGEELMSDWQAGGNAAPLAQWFPETIPVPMGGEGIGLRLSASTAAEPGVALTYGTSWQTDAGSWTLDLGIGRDDGDILPALWTGEASTLVAGEVSYTAPVADRTDLRLSAGIGAAPGSGDALVSSAGLSIQSRDLARRGDRLTLSVGLPVAVSRGTTDLTLPVRTLAGGVDYQSFDLDLAPEAREVKVELSYAWAVGAGGDMVLAAAHAENRGNVAGATSTGVFLGYRLDF